MVGRNESVVHYDIYHLMSEDIVTSMTNQSLYLPGIRVQCTIRGASTFDGQVVSRDAPVSVA